MSRSMSSRALLVFVIALALSGLSFAQKVDRADIWLNGHKVANRATVVGMDDSFEFNVAEFIIPGGANVLAVKVTPEQSLQCENGVELADSWLDWINWKYLGYHNAEKHVDISFVPDRNAGIWKRVFLSSTGAVTIRTVPEYRSPVARDQSSSVDCLLRPKEQHFQTSFGHALRRDLTTRQADD